MLQFMRKLSKSFIFKILAYVLIAAFALTGVSAGFMADFSDNYMVKVGDEKIYPQTVEQRFARMKQNLRSQGFDFSEEQLTSMGVSKNQILKSIVQEKLLTRAVKDLGISIGDEHIAEEISSHPLFQKDSKFNKEQFDIYLYQRGMREGDYIDALRNEISINILKTSLIGSNAINEKIKSDMMDNLAQTRTVRTVTIPAGKKKFAGKVEEQELKDYYFENSFMFEVEEKRSASYLVIEGEEGKEAETYELTASLEDEIAGGATLSEASEKLGVALKKVEQVGADYTGGPEILMQNIFSAEEGEPSSLIEDEDSYYIMQVDEVQKSHIPELEDIKAIVVRAYKQDMNNAETRQFASKVFNEIKEKGDYRVVARKHGLKTQKSENLKRTDFASVSFELLQDSFDAKEKEVFGVYENIDGGYDVAILESIGKMEFSEAETVELSEKLGQRQGDEILGQYLSYLIEQYPVTENPNHVAN